jgi:hypothetical protein
VRPASHPKEATRTHAGFLALCVAPRALLTDVKCDKRAAARFLFYSQGERIGDKGCETRDTHAKDSLARILRCALRIKHPSRRFICERVLFFIVFLRSARSKCCCCCWVRFYFLCCNQRPKWAKRTSLSLLVCNRLCSACSWEYNGTVLWPEMCDKLRKNCMPVIVILTLSCRGHELLLLKSCLSNPAPRV